MLAFYSLAKIILWYLFSANQFLESLYKANVFNAF